jgi:hypothetical protein
MRRRTLTMKSSSPSHRRMWRRPPRNKGRSSCHPRHSTVTSRRRRSWPLRGGRQRLG